MKTFQVWLPPVSPNSPSSENDIARLEQAIFLREGLSPLAIFFPALWLAWHRLWFELAVFILVSVVISLLAYQGYVAVYWALNLVIDLYLFLEGRKLVAAKYQRNNLELDMIIPAGSLKDAELLYFHQRLETMEGEQSALPVSQTGDNRDDSGEPETDRQKARKRYFSGSAFGLFADQR